MTQFPIHSFTYLPTGRHGLGKYYFSKPENTSNTHQKGRTVTSVVDNVLFPLKLNFSLTPGKLFLEECFSSSTSAFFSGSWDPQCFDGEFTCSATSRNAWGLGKLRERFLLCCDRALTQFSSQIFNRNL